MSPMCEFLDSKIQIHPKFRNVFTFLLFTSTCLTYLIYNQIQFSITKHPTTTSSAEEKRFKTIFTTRAKRHKQPTILFWTPFFGGMKWYTEIRDLFRNDNSGECVLSNNKSDIASADAVVLHLSDIAWYGSAITGLGVPFPKYRSSHQIWVLYTLEPLPQIWFDASSWNGLFNWTMSYRVNSDVPTPYGEFKPLTADQTDEKNTHNYYREHKKEGGIAIMSNCVDDARRYKIVEKLNKYVGINVIGKCGDDLSTDFQSRVKEVPHYKFNLALENSDCKHYVSEKYWRSLEFHQIPIVAWKNNMSGVVIPGSYINVYDFRNFEEAGKHIAEVERNETLYNSYFDWTTLYKMAYRSGWHKLCDALHTNYSNMFYHDIDGWLKDDSCKPVTAMQYLQRMFDRFVYDFRIS